jgi:hypothetical protein
MLRLAGLTDCLAERFRIVSEIRFRAAAGIVRRFRGAPYAPFGFRMRAYSYVRSSTAYLGAGMLESVPLCRLSVSLCLIRGPVTVP